MRQVLVKCLSNVDKCIKCWPYLSNAARLEGSKGAQRERDAGVCLGGPLGSFFLSAMSGAEDRSSCPVVWSVAAVAAPASSDIATIAARAAAALGQVDQLFLSP